MDYFFFFFFFMLWITEDRNWCFSHTLAENVTYSGLVSFVLLFDGWLKNVLTRIFSSSHWQLGQSDTHTTHIVIWTSDILFLKEFIKPEKHTGLCYRFLFSLQKDAWGFKNSFSSNFPNFIHSILNVWLCVHCVVAPVTSWTLSLLCHISD